MSCIMVQIVYDMCLYFKVMSTDLNCWLLVRS